MRADGWSEWEREVRDSSAYTDPGGLGRRAEELDAELLDGCDGRVVVLELFDLALPLPSRPSFSSADDAARRHT